MKRKRLEILSIGICLLFWGMYLSIPDGKLRMVFCDVGQGDGAIIIKGNWQMVIDTGADNGKMEKCLDKYLPFWDKRLEGVIISHWDKDHSGALEKMAKIYKIEKLYESGESLEGIEQKIYTQKLRAGDIVRYQEIYFEVVYPREIDSNDNGNSLVVVLNFEGRKFMFTGDISREEEGKMMAWWRGGVEGVKVSHHGSETASSGEWLQLLHPKVAVVSVGKNNYGHPSQNILERFEAVGAKVFRTDRDGEIVLGWR